MDASAIAPIKVRPQLCTFCRRNRNHGPPLSISWVLVQHRSMFHGRAQGQPPPIEFANVNLKQGQLMRLSERILGTWTLVRCISRTTDGTEFYPQGKDLRGIIIYAHDGYVSVNLMQPDRPRLQTGTELRLASDAEAGPLARGYMAYAGRYTVDESAQIIHHDFTLCLDPGMIGTPQPRHVQFVGDELKLSVPTSVTLGRNRSIHLLWRRP